VQLDRTEAKYA